MYRCTREKSYDKSWMLASSKKETRVSSEVGEKRKEREGAKEVGCLYTFQGVPELQQSGDGTTAGGGSIASEGTHLSTGTCDSEMEETLIVLF